MSDAAIQRPSPTKRGRGRGRGGGARGGASARARGKAAAGRRGRAKVYETSRAQAAHERQRDLKNAYATLAAAMKPALEELADRNLDRLKSDYNAHQEVDEYTQITNFLDERIADRRSVIAAKLDLSIGCQKHQEAAQSYYLGRSYTTRCADKVEEYYDVLLRRVDILQQLYTNGEPVDKQDDSWNFKSITTAEAAEQGIYCKIHNGVEVPYPHLHPELAQEASKTKSLRTPNKRKPLSLLEESTPRRPVSALDDKPPAAIPRHIGGLLSAVAPDEPVSQPPSPSPIDDNGDVPSPQANEPAAPGRGRKRKAPSAEPDESEAGEDETMPPLPNGAAEPDEHGVRLINKRARVNDMPNNRIMVPPLFDFEDHEIGFRDSTNDKSRGATKAKRRKFLNQPNSGAMFFDRNLCSYDATQYTDGELDQARVQEHSLHPKYGLFLANSTNESAPAKPYEPGWKPTVFVSDDGKVLHTSRSIAAAKAEGAFIKFTMQDLMKQHMNEEEITEGDLLDSETQQLITQRDAKRREFEKQEDRAQDEHQRQVASHNVSLLLDAATAAATPVKQEMQVQNESPALLRPANMSRPYDAIRDVFGGGSDLQPAASGAAAPIDNSAAMNLLLLADVAFQNEQGFEAPPAPPPPVAKEALRIPIQMPEPVRPKQLRDPSDLEQPEMPIVDYPDPDNEFVPRQLAFPNNFVGRPHDFTIPPAHAYHDRTVPPSPLAHPESFGFREAASSYDQQQQQPQREQQPRQVMQPPQPYISQKGHPIPQGVPDHYGYGEHEVVHEQQQQQRLRRQSQMSLRSEDQYNPPRPNTEDVALLDPMLFEGGQRPAPSQLQAPQPEQAKTQMSQQQGGVLQQPQNSFFQTALNSPSTPTLPDQLRVPEYPEPSQVHQQPGPPLAPAHGFPAHDGSPGRTPFSNPNGTETQPLPPLRPLHRGSGPGMPGPQMPQHMMMPPNEAGDPYGAPQPPPPPGSVYPEQAYPMDGFGPDQPLMSTEQVSRAGYMVQPPLHPSQQPPYSAYPPQQVYPPPGQVIAQAQPQTDYAPSGPPVQVLQSPPPYGSGGPGVSPSPSRRSNSISSSSRNNKQYREIKPAPRQAEAWDNGSSELRTFMYNPVEGIRDYPATAPPPSHGPTQIRGWTHSTGTRKQRAKNSTDSQIDPSLGREEKK